MTRQIEVAVTLPVHGRFNYRVPGDWPPLSPGTRLRVPFGRRQATAFVLQDPAPSTREDTDLKEVMTRIDEQSLVPPDVLELALFAARYYVAPLGSVLQAALPPSLTGSSTKKLFPSIEGAAFLRGEEEGSLSLAPEIRRWLEKSEAGLAAKEVPSNVRRVLDRSGLWREQDEMLIRREMAIGIESYLRSLEPRLAWPLIKRSARERDIFELLEEGPRSLEFLRRRVGASARRVLDRMVEKGVLERRLLPPDQTPFTGGPDLTQEQDSVLQALDAAPPGGAFLLQGVTGSGKTEVYLRQVQAVLEAGRGAIVMVPEIGLTPQLEARFKDRLGERVVTLHSGLSPKQRLQRWSELRHGHRSVALGPRSAVWAPVQALGLIVVDEEHDASYKQNTDLRYNARDLAQVRARSVGARLILGSATPSLESYAATREDRLQILHLRERVHPGPLPEVRIVDMIDEEKGSLVSTPLAQALEACLEAGEQAILYLNRRGFNTFVVCGTCQTHQRCPSCDVSLTLHRPRRLVCHHCGYTRDIESPCSGCGAQTPEPFGTGTQRIETIIGELLPQARVLRLDRDAATTPKKLAAILEAFGRRDADILVGTRMVTKGHDFSGVSLVGILSADASLCFPDFRAQESTFQLLTQTAGRAGRRARRGRVIVQTLQPEHPVVQMASQHDVEGFLAFEARHREAGGHPPFGRLGMLRCESEDAKAATHGINKLAEEARRMAGDVAVLGPTEAPIGRIKGRYRHRLLLRSERPASLIKRLHALLEVELPSQVHRVIDVDPTDFL
ncbi:MAG: primosomal protein N' [Myxococcota bacterium]